MNEETNESGLNDPSRNDRLATQLDATSAGFFTDEIDTNLVNIDENELLQEQTRKNLAKKIENGMGDYSVIYDVKENSNTLDYIKSDLENKFCEDIDFILVRDKFLAVY